MTTTEEKTVTFLVSTISNGGAEAVCVNIANGLAELGWQVDLLVLHTKEKSYINRLSPKVNLVDLKANRTRYAAPALLWRLLSKKPKQIVVFKYELIDLVVLIKNFFRLNLRIVGRNISILSKKDMIQSPSLSNKIIKKLFGTPIEQVDCIINQSFEMEKDLLNLLPSLKQRSVVIHNPVAVHIEQHVKQNGLKKIGSERYILCVGRLEEVKAFHHAIEAFALVSRKKPDIRLKFIGKGSLEKPLRELTVQLGVQDRVDFRGFQADVIPYYQQAQLVLLTSNYEGFPNVLIESIVLGTPVVSFNCPSGPREILDYGKYGKLVEPGDISGLAAAIEETLENPNQFNLAERAEFFSVAKAIDKYIKVLRQD